MRTKFFYILGLASLATGFAACSTGNASKEKAAKPAESKLPVDVLVTTETQDQQSETISGSIIPNREVPVMSEVTKRVVAVAFKDGSFVNAGQLLYKLDDADIQARLRQLRAELKLASINEHRLKELLRS